MEITSGKKTALIIGTTGLVGRHCLDELLNNPAYAKVVSLGRRKLDITHDKLDQHIVDFDKLATFRHLVRCHDIYICLGTTMAKAGSKEVFYKVDHDYVINTALTAKELGADQCLLVSALNADEDSVFFYNQVKGAVEKDIENMEFWSTHIFRPSILLGARDEDRLLEDIAKKIGKGMAAVFGNSLKKYRPTEAEHLAIAMNKVAQRIIPGLHYYNSNQIYDIAAGEQQQLQQQ